MLKNRGMLLALCTTAACVAFGCNESVPWMGCGGPCPDGTVCNEIKDICEVPDPCNNQCASNEKCNAVTGLCELVTVDACNNTCVAPFVCDETTKSCKDPNADVCNPACVAPLVCDAVTKTCYDPNACDPACVAPKKCSASKTCVDCLNNDDCTDGSNGRCLADGTCHYGTPCGGACGDSLKCNEATNTCVECISASDCTEKANGQCQQDGTCKYPSASSKCSNGCGAGQACDEDAGKCVMIQACEIEYNECDSDEKCELSVIGYEGLRVCRAGHCVNTKCMDKTWDPKTQRCGGESGEVVYCGCNNNDECQDPTPVCDMTTHVCIADPSTCEDDVDVDNFVPNWSFEEWNGGEPEFWSFESDYNGYGSIEKSSDAVICSSSVRLTTTSDDNSRLESDPITIPEVSYTASDPALQLKCSFNYKGTAFLNIGYRARDAKGGKVKFNEDAVQKTLSSAEWARFEFSEKEKLNPPLNAENFSFTLGFHKPQGENKADILIDGFECYMNSGICEGVVCEEWEICSLNGKKDPETNKYVGQCMPRDGYCSVTEAKPEQGTCSTNQKCDATTHTCKAIDGTCLSNKDCTDDAAPVCAKETDSNLYKCVAGDPCENAKCPEWKECTLASRGSCVLKAGRCMTSADCPKEKSACYGNDHECVEPDTVYNVESAKKCPIAKDYFNYLNYEDKDPKKPQLYDSLVCPINIIPNGSFEDWVELQFTEKADKHDIPDWWYAMDDYHNFVTAAYKYMTELKFDAIKEYTTNAYDGERALQLIYTTKGGNNRLTSWGFKVPDGNWDCSYWVRGKGNVKVHTYSNRGDAKATDYVAYDTNEWTRATFNLVENASDARIIIYVSETDANKEHIQLDNFVCTRKGSII